MIVPDLNLILLDLVFFLVVLHLIKTEVSLHCALDNLGSCLHHSFEPFKCDGHSFWPVDAFFFCDSVVDSLWRRLLVIMSFLLHGNENHSAVVEQTKNEG